MPKESALDGEGSGENDGADGETRLTAIAPERRGGGLEEQEDGEQSERDARHGYARRIADCGHGDPDHGGGVHEPRTTDRRATDNTNHRS